MPSRAASRRRDYDRPARILNSARQLHAKAPRYVGRVSPRLLAVEDQFAQATDPKIRHRRSRSAHGIHETRHVAQHPLAGDEAAGALPFAFASNHAPRSRNSFNFPLRANADPMATVVNRLGLDEHVAGKCRHRSLLSLRHRHARSRCADRRYPSISAASRAVRRPSRRGRVPS